MQCHFKTVYLCLDAVICFQFSLLHDLHMASLHFNCLLNSPTLNSDTTKKVGNRFLLCTVILHPPSLVTIWKAV